MSELSEERMMMLRDKKALLRWIEERSKDDVDKRYIVGLLQRILSHEPRAQTIEKLIKGP